MKIKVFLVLYIVFNIALFAHAFLWKAASPQSLAVVPLVTEPGKVAPSVLTNTSRVSASAAGFQWAQLESENYKTYISNLRAIGCPEMTIREIIIADIDKLYAPKERAARINPNEPIHYWDSKTAKASIAEAESRLKLIEIKKEKNELIYELLGVSMPVYGDNEMPLYGLDPQKVLASVPVEKRSIVASITQKYDLIGQEMFNKGLYTPEDHRRLNDVRKKMMAELEATLGVDGAREYYAKTSWLGKDLRNQLVGFNATEAEFRAIHDSKESLDYKYGNMSHYEPGDSEGRAAYQAAARQTELKIEAALGPERYSDYKRSYDTSYQSLLRLVTNEDIPGGEQIASSVYAIKSEAQQQRNQIMVDQTISAADKGAALNRMRTEIEAKVQKVMPPDLYQKYRPQAGGWINQISGSGPR